MTPPSEANNKAVSDCYSAGERRWMEYGQRVRAWLLAPSLWLLTRWGVRADTVTLLSGIAGLAFAPCWLLGYEPWAIACLCVHVLLDGLDGPCARFQGTASARGSFTDTFVDQVVVAAVTLAWMIAHASAWAIALGGIYIFLYTTVVAMAMVRNALAVPYTWLIRPRFFVFAALAIEALGVRWIMFPTLGVCALLLAAKTGSGFVQLRNSIPGSEP